MRKCDTMKYLLSRIFILCALCFTLCCYVGCEDDNTTPPPTEEEPSTPEPTPEVVYPVLEQFGFAANDNVAILSSDVECNIADNVVTFATVVKTLKPVIPGVELIPTFKVGDGCEVFVGEQLQESGKSRQDFSGKVEYRVVDKDGNQSIYTVSLKFDYTGIPIVAISTEGGAAITSKDDWVKASFALMGGAEFDNIETMDIEIAGRGNSTWRYAKKPYKLKLSKKTEVLGMPKHKRWVLLANYIDKTMLRNDLAFYLGKKTALAWTPRGYHVELILNGEHMGNYYLCEQIKIDENRVNITELGPEEQTNITGGYLMEMDTYEADDDETPFKSKHKVNTQDGDRNINIKIKDPEREDLTQQQFDYITGYFYAFEDALFGENWLDEKSGYKNYIDIISFIDIYLVSELIYHWEWRHPKSSYLYKDRDGKLCSGPMWDYDWKTFTVKSGWYCKDYLWYPRLFTDPEFVALLKERWAVLYPEFQSAVTYLNKKRSQLLESAEKNFAIWGEKVNGTNGEDNINFKEAANRLTTNFIARLDWLNAEIEAL